LDFCIIEGYRMNDMNSDLSRQAQSGSNKESLSESLSRVKYEVRGRVAHITLNRPNVLNAMDIRMHEELGYVWDDFERDDELWIGVLTGAGSRSFSVGQDLKELVERTRTGVPPSSFGSAHGAGWPRLTERFRLSKPLIARVNGYAFGGGFELALACDIIIASEEASFALPEAKLGLIPGAGGLFRLTRQVPYKVAIGHLMTGRSMSAKRAYELGLVNEVVAGAALDNCVEQWIEDILRCAPLSIRAIKQVGLTSSHLALEEAFTTRYEAEDIRRHSKDCQEGPLAFVEKRAPKWSAK
jgi:crotonobetainyl-CoA hydratase/dehydration protein DpgD